MVAVDACIDHCAHGMVPCDAAVVVRTRGAVAIRSMPIVEKANAIMSGRPVPVPRCQIVIVPVQIEKQTRAEEISVAL